MGTDYTLGKPLNRRQQRIWDIVSRFPLRSLWNLQGISLHVVAQRTWRSLLTDNIFGHAAELGFYFLFALFPTLFSASSILGLAARSANRIYENLLHYLALVIPTAALGTVLETFNETTAASTSGKLTFGLIAAIWSASVGISAIQDTLNIVYKVQVTRSYFRARIYAIGLTIILTIIVRVIAEGAKLPQIPFPETSLGCVIVFYSLRIVAAAALHVSVRASFSDAMKRMTQAA
jgi:membrane protein